MTSVSPPLPSILENSISSRRLESSSPHLENPHPSTNESMSSNPPITNTGNTIINNSNTPSTPSSTPTSYGIRLTFQGVDFHLQPCQKPNSNGKGSLSFYPNSNGQLTNINLHDFTGTLSISSSNEIVSFPTVATSGARGIEAIDKDGPNTVVPETNIVSPPPKSKKQHLSSFRKEIVLPSPTNLDTTASNQQLNPMNKCNNRTTLESNTIEDIEDVDMISSQVSKESKDSSSKGPKKSGRNSPTTSSSLQSKKRKSNRITQYVVVQKKSSRGGNSEVTTRENVHLSTATPFTKSVESTLSQEQEQVEVKEVDEMEEGQDDDEIEDEDVIQEEDSPPLPIQQSQEEPEESLLAQESFQGDHDDEPILVEEQESNEKKLNHDLILQDTQAFDDDEEKDVKGLGRTKPKKRSRIISYGKMSSVTSQLSMSSVGSIASKNEEREANDSDDEEMNQEQPQESDHDEEMEEQAQHSQNLLDYGLESSSEEEEDDDGQILDGSDKKADGEVNLSQDLAEGIESESNDKDDDKPVSVVTTLERSLTASSVASCKSMVIPCKRWGQTMTMIDHSRIMVYGGEEYDETTYTTTTLSDLYVYSVPTKDWYKPIQCEGMSRVWHTSTFLPERQLVITFGGETYDVNKRRTVTTDSLMVFDTEIMLWYPPTVSGDAPAGRSGHSCSYIPDTNDLIFFGGVGKNSKWLNTVLVLDSMSWRWRAVEILGTAPKARSYHTATTVTKMPQSTSDITNSDVANEKQSIIVVFGGNDGEQSFNTVHVLDTSGNSWKWSSPKMSGTPPSPRTGHSATLLNDGKTILIAGGWDPMSDEVINSSSFMDDPICRDSFILDTETWKWNPGPLISGVMIQRTGHSAALSSEFIIGAKKKPSEIAIFGGRLPKDTFANDFQTFKI